MISVDACETESSVYDTSPSYKPEFTHADLIKNAAFNVSDDWIVFSAHKNYVRPTRSHEYYHGEPCRLRSRASGRGPEIPPGASKRIHALPPQLLRELKVPLHYINIYRYDHSMGHPATCWDAFLFPNPSRKFLLSRPQNNFIMYATDTANILSDNNTKPHGGNLAYMDPISHCKYHPGSSDTFQERLQRFRRFNIVSPNSSISSESELLDDLERQLWLDPEIRIDRPFRIYADSRYCTKGNCIRDMSQLMRPGW